MSFLPGVWFSVGVMILFAGSCFAVTETSSGVGTGVPCGNKTCAPHASCSSKERCVCDSPTVDSGNGYLHCHSSDEISAFLVNDPILCTYEGEEANVALPCRYEFSNVQTTADFSLAPAQCTLEFLAFNRKDRGKFYVHGFDMMAKLDIASPINSTEYFSMRVSGVAYDGNYHYEMNATHGEVPDGPYGDDNVWEYLITFGIQLEFAVRTTLKETENMITVDLPHCGIKIVFRPYDVITRNKQPLTPGLAFILDNQNNPLITDPNLHNDDIALRPNFLRMVDLYPPGVSSTEKIIYRALGTLRPWISPLSNAQCAEKSHLYSLMGTDLNRALENCVWMLLSPKFINCYDQTEIGEPIMALFFDCARVITGHTLCSDVQQLIMDAGCDAIDPDNDKLVGYMNNNCETV